MKNNFIVNVIKTVISAVLGLILLNIFNIFDYFSIVPNDSKYDVGTAIYFSIIDTVLSAILNKIDNKFYSNVQCIFYNTRNGADIEKNPIINFNEDVAKISVKIIVTGHSSQLRKMSIKFILPKWITVQTDSKIARVTEDTHACILEIDNIIPSTGKKENADTNIDFDFIRDSIDQTSYSLEGQLKFRGLCKMCNFVSNSVNIKP